MRPGSITLSALNILLCALVRVHGHGRMLLPPSRPSAWRLDFNTPIDYNDNSLYCGGFDNQWKVNGGKCGLCGDPWEQNPRDHERPDGKFVSKTNFILSSYRQGDTIEIDIQLTAAHLGYFEFRLCSVDTVPGRVEATLNCFNQNLLPLSTGGFQFPVTNGSGHYRPFVKLPALLTCNHCVLQWKYHVGNNWGCGSDGRCCLGCNPQQEEFYSCADIQITTRDGALPVTDRPPVTTTTTTPRPVFTTKAPTTLAPIDLYPLTQREKDFFQCNYCAQQCFLTPNGICPSQLCSVFRACPRSLDP